MFLEPATAQPQSENENQTKFTTQPQTRPHTEAA